MTKRISTFNLPLRAAFIIWKFRLQNWRTFYAQWRLKKVFKKDPERVRSAICSFVAKRDSPPPPEDA